MTPPSPFLLVEDVAKRLRCSTRTVHEMTRLNEIPHFKRPGGRRCLFHLDELEAWEQGVPLETITLPRGGRTVRTARATPAARGRPALLAVNTRGSRNSEAA